MDVEQFEDGSIVINQDAYRDGLEASDVDVKDDPSRSLTKKEYKEFRGAAGKLNWLSAMPRPDLAYESVEHSGHNKDAKVRDLKSINKLV